MAVKPKSTKESIAARRLALADKLLDDLERLRKQLFAPVTERKAMSVSDGTNAGSHVEVVDIDLDEPTFAAKRLIVASIGEGIAKVGELTGSDASDGYDDWTAPAGTTSIRDGSRRASGDAGSAGGRGGKAARAGADAAAAAHLGRGS